MEKWMVEGGWMLVDAAVDAGGGLISRPFGVERTGRKEIGVRGLRRGEVETWLVDEDRR
jgi:hypothetical protein